MPLPVPTVFTAEGAKLKILLYGEPGAGKTTLAATAQEHPLLGPILALNLEGGMLSVASRGIEFVDVPNIPTLEEIYRALWANDPLYMKYKTIVIDSGSEMYTKAITEIVATAREAGIGTGGKVTRTIDDFNVEDYGTAGNRIFRLFRAFRNLDRHVIITAHPKTTFARDNKGAPTSVVTEVKPNFSGQLANKLIGCFDCVWFMYKKTDKHGVIHRNLLTDDHGAYKGKTRGEFFAPALGLVVQDKTLPEIYELMLKAESLRSHEGLVKFDVPADVSIPTPVVEENESTQAVAAADAAEASGNESFDTADVALAGSAV